MARVLGAGERISHCPLARYCVRHCVCPGATDVVLVLGDVGQMREIAKCADDPDGLVVGEAADDRLEFLTRRSLGVAMEPQRGLADALDNSEDLIAFLGADGFAEDTAEQPDVVAQRRILVACLIRLLHRMARSNAVVRPDSSAPRCAFPFFAAPPPPAGAAPCAFFSETVIRLLLC